MTTVESAKTPLFPLGQTLYPGVAMKLRIFEQRYLQLVKESMRSGASFGIVPIIRGREVGSAPTFFPWGTLVNIVDFNQQPDGLLGITIKGDRRFNVLKHSVREDGLIIAAIETLAAEPVAMPGPQESDLTLLLQELVTSLEVQDFFPDPQPTLGDLSWRLGTLLPLPPDIKRSLLKEDDPHVRLDIIRECLVDLANGEKPIN